MRSPSLSPASNSVTKTLTVEDDAPPPLDFQLTLKGESQTVTVNSNDSGLDLNSSSGNTPALNASNLKSLLQLNQDFQDALPLLPGVVRGIDGLIRIKGGRTNQANTLVNSATVTDPFTGQAALSLPAVAVQSVQVLANPFSAEYGRFASGVVDVSTRGGTDEWKTLFEDPVPRFRWIDHRHTHGVESASPHLTFAGPLDQGEALHLPGMPATDTTPSRCPRLPDPNNVRIVEKLNSYTQLDWTPSASHRLTAVVTRRSAKHRLRQHQHLQPAAGHGRRSRARILSLPHPPLDPRQWRLHADLVLSQEA